MAGGVVSYAGSGNCTLQASVLEGTNHLAATGVQHSFAVTALVKKSRFSLPVDMPTAAAL